MEKFTHLNLHTEYSIQDGLIRIKELADKAEELNFESLAISDLSNLFGYIKFYKALRKKGIKPICSSDFILSGKNSDSGSIQFVAKNHNGYKNLIRLISKAHTDGKINGDPQLEVSFLESFSSDLIAITGSLDSQIGKSIISGKNDIAAKQIKYLRNIYKDNFFLQISRIGRDQEELCNQGIIEIAHELSIPVVATNQVRFLEKSDFEAHETRVCIQSGFVLGDQRRSRDYQESQFFKSSEQMYELFKDIPEALSNSYELSKKCNLEIKTDIYVLPDFETPSGSPEAEYLKELTEVGILKKLKLPNINNLDQIYRDRLNFELKVILEMGYEGYFLIVADFVNWAKQNEVPVGPGRGSGAGSLIAFALGITGIDPIKYDLLFERFLNPDRISNPDFDIDFCRDGREKVIDYVTNKYGKNAVAQICTFGTMAARAVVRDVARAQGKSYGLADRLAKMIPFSPEMTLERALSENNDLKQAIKVDEDASEIFEMARKLEGIIRNVGKHAAGVVMAPSEINDFSPLYLDESSQTLATQFDMKDIESVGLQKFDFLGLKTLTVINKALKSINASRNEIELEPINIESLELDDKGTFELLQKGLTTAVFQLESRGIKEYIVKLKPSNFEDIIALVALYRPGPLDMKMVDTYINRKKGKEETRYGDEDVEKVLKSTFGVIIYQEQVMQLAQEFSGFSLGQADILRRAMGKKIPEEMEIQRPVFIEGAVKKGKSERFAEGLFDQIETFAGYGFNKSHSAAYAMISYQTAWLKSHYPAQFMAAALSSELGDAEKIQLLLDDINLLGLKILPPDINRSVRDFITIDNETILFGLGAIKGVGEPAIENIIEERKAKTFNSLNDFTSRVDLKRVDKRSIEPLIKSGAMDSFSEDRIVLLKKVEGALRFARQKTETRESGIQDLFGEINDSMKMEENSAPSKFLDLELSKLEFSSLGFYLSFHPMDEHSWEVRKLCPDPIISLGQSKYNQRCAGVLISQKRINTRRGPLVFATLDDKSDRIELIISADVLEKLSNSLDSEIIYIVDGEITEENSKERENLGLSKKMKVSSIQTLEEARIKLINKISLSLDHQNSKKIDNFIKDLKSYSLEDSSEGCPVELRYSSKEVNADIEILDDFKILLNDENIKKLKKSYGIDNIDLHYFSRQ
tara:strand:- start:21922 stop:25377 length:3456 start_codon:yes stop_codon:yes gene_type:complete